MNIKIILCNRIIIQTALILGLFIFSNEKALADRNNKPNIIFIISDDVGFEEIGCYGVIDRESITPNIDSLAEKGVRFNTCYAQAICGPSRAMLYTGNYAVNTGQYDNKLKYLVSDATLSL